MASNTHFVSFSGRIIENLVTNKASAAETWIRNIKSKLRDRTIVVGFNCKFVVHHFRSPENRVATLQLCADTHCLILQLLHMEFNSLPQRFKDFLIDPELVFVGIDVSEVVPKLGNEYGLRFGKKIDVRAVARVHFLLSYHGKPGLKALAYEIANLGSWKPRNFVLNSVQNGALDEETVKFACVDAYACYRIGHRLLIETC